MAAVFAAVLAGGAAAKAPPEGIEICGQDGCVSVAQADAERLVTVVLYGGDVEPAAPAPFFLVRWQWPNAREQKVRWVPRGGRVLATDGLWRSQSVASEAVMKRLTTALEPFPVPTLTRAIVGGRVAENPQSYLRLLRGGTLIWKLPPARGWISVHLTSLEPSPWTNDSTWLQVSKVGSWVRRDASIYRVPPALAERARTGLSLRPFARAG